MVEIRWNEAAGRYIAPNGTFISDARVRAVIDAVADHASDRMAVASQALLGGRTSLAAWQASLMQDIKSAHVASGVLAHGGVQQMQSQDWLSIAREIKPQYSWLRAFAAQVQSGEQQLNGLLVARARQYGQASRGTFAKLFGEDQQQRGYLWEKNVIQSGESCAGCRAESAKGWTPTGTLVPVGSRRPCGPNCRCRVLYSKAREAAA